jgi:hypothetical protein
MTPVFAYSSPLLQCGADRSHPLGQHGHVFVSSLILVILLSGYMFFTDKECPALIPENQKTARKQMKASTPSLISRCKSRLKFIHMYLFRTGTVT